MSATLETRTVPHDLEAERAILGAVLLRAERLDDATVLGPEDFFRTAHQDIWRTMVALRDRQQDIDPLTLCHALGAKGAEAVGGVAYLSALVDGVPRGTHVATYADRVRRLSLLRQALDAARAIEDMAYDPDTEPAALLEAAERALLALRVSRAQADFATSEDVAHRVYQRLERMAEATDWGVPTGFPTLDGLTRGLQPTQLVVVAARPGIGKSALALNVAEHVSRSGRTVAIFSLEMSADELGWRSVLGRSGVGRLTRHTLEATMPALLAAITSFSAERIYIADDPVITVAEMRARCRRLRARAGLDLVIVDYIGLVTARGKFSNRQEIVADISRSLKQLAKELQVPVLALSQLNRESEKRENKKPQLSDLRESGALEQDADVAWLLWREQDPSAPDADTDAELTVAKQRNGPAPFTVPLRFEASRTRFSEREWRSE